MTEGPFDEPVRVPIGPEIDLHTFAPKEVRAVLEAYFEACVQQRLVTVRVVHGKGTGTLRASVQAILAKSPLVKTYRQAEPTAGFWGATIVELAVPKEDTDDASDSKKVSPKSPSNDAR